MGLKPFRIALALLIILTGTAWAGESVTLGVLAYRPKPETIARWQPTADYLSSQVGRPFQLEALSYAELESAIQSRRLDFVLTNPAHYVLMTKRNGLSSPLATLVADENGHALAKFGGVVIARTGNDDITDLRSLRGKIVAVSSLGSLGGSVMQAYELHDLGMHIPGDVEPLTTGMPQDRVVYAVLDGAADAGFVRTGLIEAMRSEGKLDGTQLKVINPRTEPGFPFLLSTRLYPEWPFAAMPQVDEELARKVTAALYSMPANHPAARKGKYHGWSIPTDYEPVRAMLQALRLPPFDQAPDFTVQDILDKHYLTIVTGAAGIAIIVLLLILLNKRHHEMWQQEQRLANTRDQLLSALGEGVYGVDASGRCTFVNPAAQTMLGYAADELMGKDLHAIIHAHFRNGTPYPAEQCPVHLTLGDGLTRHADETFIRKDGQHFAVNITVAPMERADTRVGVVVVFRDFEERKHMEEELQAMATTDPLTGLPNRRHFLTGLDQEAARIHRFEDSQSVLVMLDIDHFKQVNDSHGHAAGDRVLVRLAELMRSSLRKTDMAGRLGGEEFAILLTGTDPANAMDYAERLRKRIMADDIDLDGTRIRITVSMGVTPLLPQDASIDITLARSDAALYRAKSNGRNRVELDSGGSRLRTPASLTTDKS